MRSVQFYHLGSFVSALWHDALSFPFVFCFVVLVSLFSVGAKEEWKRAAERAILGNANTPGDKRPGGSFL